jgi:hypothetical protein
MNSLIGPVLAFLASGNYLLFWPVYRLFHPRKTQRRQALLRLFVLELVIYCLVTGSLLAAFHRIPNFHHGGLLLAEFVYLVLLLVFWTATYGVWADNSPYDVD